MSPVIISLGVLCHLPLFPWEPCATCCPFTWKALVTCCHFPWGGLVSPAVISLGRPCHLLSSRGEPRVACCRVMPCDCWLGCNQVHTCARGTR